MTARSKLRGHPIYWDGDRFRYEDDDTPTVDGWKTRPCGHCGLVSTSEGHDPCLGTLPGVANACCGHGVREESYIQFSNGVIVKGFTRCD